MAKVYAGWSYNLCQMGRESTAGTAVVATTVWRGPFGGFEDDRVREEVEEVVGVLIPTKRLYDSEVSAKVSSPATVATYEQLPHLFEAGIRTATPSGAGPYVRTYNFATSGAPDPIKTYTLEVGNRLAPADLKKLPFSFVEEITLSGKAGEAWEMEATWRAQQLVTLSAFTSAIALPSVTDIMFSNTRLYIDAVGGTIGTTQVPGVLMAAKIRIKTGLVRVPVGDGNLYYSAIKSTPPEVTMLLTLELEQDGAASVVATERGYHASRTGRLIRLQVPGPSSANLNLDISAMYNKVAPYNKEGDGNTTVDFDCLADYNATAALYFSAAVTNATATM